MNERIKELLLNARNMFVNGVTESDNKIYIHGSEENLEKFAELIVRECTKLIEETTEDDEYWSRVTGAESIMAIEEHFGIEE